MLSTPKLGHAAKHGTATVARGSCDGLTMRCSLFGDVLRERRCQQLLPGSDERRSRGHLERLLRGCVPKWVAWPVMLASGGPTCLPTHGCVRTRSLAGALHCRSWALGCLGSSARVLRRLRAQLQSGGARGDSAHSCCPTAASSGLNCCLWGAPAPLLATAAAQDWTTGAWEGRCCCGVAAACAIWQLRPLDLGRRRRSRRSRSCATEREGSAFGPAGEATLGCRGHRPSEGCSWNSRAAAV